MLRPILPTVLVGDGDEKELPLLVSLVLAVYSDDGSGWKKMRSEPMEALLGRWSVEVEKWNITFTFLILFSDDERKKLVASFWFKPGFKSYLTAPGKRGKQSPGSNQSSLT